MEKLLNLCTKLNFSLNTRSQVSVSECQQGSQPTILFISCKGDSLFFMDQRLIIKNTNGIIIFTVNKARVSYHTSNNQTLVSAPFDNDRRSKRFSCSSLCFAYVSREELT